MPWRRLLLELSDTGHKEEEEEYVRSRRRLGISAESVWLVEAFWGRSDGRLPGSLRPERALGEFAASESPFETWHSGRMRKLFGFDLARVPRARSDDLLFASRDDARGEREASNNS